MAGKFHPAPKGTGHLIAPELRAGLDRLPDFDLDDAFVAALRRGEANLGTIFDQPPLPPALAAVARNELFVPGINGAPDVRVLHYAPPGEAASPRPAYLYIHGGGYVLGSADMMDIACRSKAVDHDCIVVSVDYRLAPETCWPGAVEDCYAALCWLHDNAASLGVDPARVAIGGESAGGGHSAALALWARDHGGPPICFQLLDCPMLDDRTGTVGDPHPWCGEFGWTPAKNHYGWSAMLGVEAGSDAVDPRSVPGRRDDLAGLPPAFISIGSLDLFLDESLDYARRLMRAGVPIELHVFTGGYHGFGITGPDAPQVKAQASLQRAAIARAFATA